jgi:hypothetical protein
MRLGRHLVRNSRECCFFNGGCKKEEAAAPPTTIAPAASVAPEAGSGAATRSVELVRTPLGLGLSVNSQFKVVAIADGSQAQRSGGFAVRDQLVSLNGQPPSDGASFEEQLGAIPVGTKVKIEVGSPAEEGVHRNRKGSAAGGSGAGASGAMVSSQPSRTLFKRSRVGTYKQVEVVIEGATLRYFEADQSIEVKSGDVDRLEVVNHSRLEFALHTRKPGSEKSRPIVFRAVTAADFTQWVSDLEFWLHESEGTATSTTSQ